MIKVYLKYIQSIGEHIFEFPDSGLIQFVGDNSNGKSIFGKVLKEVIFQRLVDDDKRLPLINDDQQMALFGMEYNNKKLIVVIDRELDKCIYQLIREDETSVVRKLRDDGIDELLREFGFLIYNKRSVCLQLCETFGPMPFVNTTDTCNGEIVKSVITDVPSERFIEDYKVTFKEAKTMMTGYDREINSVQNQIDAIIPINVAGFSELAERMRKCFNLNRLMPKINELEMKFIPVFHFDMTPMSKFEVLSIPYFIDHQAVSFKSLDFMFDKLNKIERGVCPTCGRKLLDGGHHG